MRTVYADTHRLHHGDVELNEGEMVPCFERPDRADVVLARVEQVGLGEVMPTTDHGLAPVARVHTADYLDFLGAAWDDWTALGRTWNALPQVAPARTLRQDRVPTTVDGRLAYYAFDAGTPIMAGTWQAARAAVDVALTGCDLLLAGDRAAFSLCRPPGHHAAADAFGGYCFLNNAAIAAQYLRDSGAEKVGILDVDYHHGNGTQSIFFDRGDVVVTSIHADPSVEYPYFLGFSDEVGVGAGSGANANFPMAPGTAWPEYSDVLDLGLRYLSGHGVDALVVSLGLDTYEGDPISQFRLTSDDFLRMGSRFASLGIPVNFVFEGGYAVAELGENAVNVLSGFAGS